MFPKARHSCGRVRAPNGPQRKRENNLNLRRDIQGFTLLEIMVSVVILVALMLGVGASLTTSVRATSYNEDRHIADQLAEGLLEGVIDFAAQGATNFSALVPNDFQGSISENQPAIPGVRPAIPNEPTSDRLYDDFDGDGTVDWGLGGKNIYVYQMIIGDVPVGGATGFLKQVTIRIYYAQQNPAAATVDPARHNNPGGQLPRRFSSPLADVTTYIALP